MGGTRLTDLPEEVVLQILCYLSLDELCILFQVNKSFGNFASVETFWESWFTLRFLLPVSDYDLRFLGFSWKSLCRMRREMVLYLLATLM